MTETNEDPATLRVKAEHRQLMARQEAELDAQRLHGLPFAARMYFDPVLFDRMNLMAERMATSKGMPRHIQGDTIMALYCIERGWSWGMSPLAVAMGTFKIGDAIGHYGRTIIAAINNSGRLNEALKFEHFAEGNGSWDKVTANFREMESKKKQDEHGNPAKYLVPNYTRADEQGLGVTITGHIRGEPTPRELKFYLKQAWPRNSTLWATDPARQICYTAARAFANLYMPEIVAGARMEDDFEPPMRDITPTSAAALDADPMDRVVAEAQGNGHASTSAAEAHQAQPKLDRTPMPDDDASPAGEPVAQEQQPRRRGRPPKAREPEPELEPEPVRYHPETGEIEPEAGDGSTDADDDYQTWLSDMRKDIDVRPIEFLVSAKNLFIRQAEQFDDGTREKAIAAIEAAVAGRRSR